MAKYQLLMLPTTPLNIHRRCSCHGIAKGKKPCHQPHCPDSDCCKGCGRTPFFCRIMGNCPLDCLRKDYSMFFGNKTDANAKSLANLDTDALNAIYLHYLNLFNSEIRRMLDDRKDDDKFIIQQIQNLLKYIWIVLDYSHATLHHIQCCLRKCIKLRQFFAYIQTRHMAPLAPPAPPALPVQMDLVNSSLLLTRELPD